MHKFKKMPVDEDLPGEGGPPPPGDEVNTKSYVNGLLMSTETWNTARLAFRVSGTPWNITVVLGS